jgi:hypothetical protein
VCERHHHFKVNHVHRRKRPTDRAAVGNARHPFPAATWISAKCPSFFRRQGRVVLVSKIDIPDWSVPINEAVVMRLVVSAPFGKRQGKQGSRQARPSGSWVLTECGKKQEGKQRNKCGFAFHQPTCRCKMIFVRNDAAQRLVSPAAVISKTPMLTTTKFTQIAAASPRRRRSGANGVVPLMKWIPTIPYHIMVIWICETLHLARGYIHDKERRSGGH